MVFGKVSERVYADTEAAGLGNAGAVQLQHRTVVVDAQFAVSVRALRNNIQNVSVNKITHLLLTHSHSDHVFGNEVFEDCEIVGHTSLKSRMQELLVTSWSKESLQMQADELRKTDPERAARFENVRIVLPAMTFDRQLELGDDGLKVEMIHTGGHTADSSIVYFPHSKTLFAGDLIFAGIYPYGGDPTADPDLWLEGLRSIQKIGPEVIVPGHGPICGLGEVGKYIRYISETKSVMLRMIAEKKSVDQAIVDPSLPEFYGQQAEARRVNTLRQWYEVWRRKTS